MQDACSPAAGSAVFLIKMAGKDSHSTDSSVSGEKLQYNIVVVVATHICECVTTSTTIYYCHFIFIF